MSQHSFCWWNEHCSSGVVGGWHVFTVEHPRNEASFCCVALSYILTFQECLEWQKKWTRTTSTCSLFCLLLVYLGFETEVLQFSVTVHLTEKYLGFLSFFNKVSTVSHFLMQFPDPYSDLCRQRATERFKNELLLQFHFTVSCGSAWSLPLVEDVPLLPASPWGSCPNWRQVLWASAWKTTMISHFVNRAVQSIKYTAIRYKLKITLM